MKRWADEKKEWKDKREGRRQEVSLAMIAANNH